MVKLWNVIMGKQIRFHFIMVLWWNKHGETAKIIHISSHGEMVRWWNDVTKTYWYHYGEMVKQIWFNGVENAHKFTWQNGETQ